MVYTIIWLTILGIALLVPNVLAIRLAIFGDGTASATLATGTGAVTAAKATVVTRPAVRRASPKFVRRGYLWKALSPFLFGVTVILGLALDGAVGYAVMGAGLLNLVFGILGWDAYIPGKKVIR
jgi:hypothetical protein